MTATLLDGIMSNKIGEKTKWERFYKEKPKFAEKLRTFGEVGVVLDYKKQKIKNKLDNKREIHYFVGYSRRQIRMNQMMKTIQNRKKRKMLKYKKLNRIQKIQMNPKNESREV